MYCEELANGKVKYIESYKDPLTDKWKRVSITYPKDTNQNRKQAFLVLQDKIKERIHTDSIDNPDLTFAEAYEAWFEVYKHTVKPSTATSARVNMVRMLTLFGYIPIKNLEAHHFNRFFIDMQSQRIYKSQVCKLLKSLVTRIIKHAYKYFGVDKICILKDLEVIPINQSDNNDWKYLESDELNTVLDFLSAHGYEEKERMVRIMVNTGMRYGEMACLNYLEDINMDHNTIEVKRIYDHLNHIFTLPKTNETRTIFFPDSLKPVILHQIQADKLKAIKYRLGIKDPMLFRGMKGTPQRVINLNNTLRQIEIPGKKVTSHIFRHTFITVALENGMDKNLIAKQVGHNDTTMIDQVYAHFSETMSKQQKEAMLKFEIV